MGVSKNSGTPKWMVKIMENPIKMDDLVGFPPIFRKHPYTLPETNIASKSHPLEDEAFFRGVCC